MLYFFKIEVSFVSFKTDFKINFFFITNKKLQNGYFQIK